MGQLFLLVYPFQTRKIAGRKGHFLSRKEDFPLAQKEDLMSLRELRDKLARERAKVLEELGMSVATKQLKPRRRNKELISLASHNDMSKPAFQPPLAGEKRRSVRQSDADARGTSRSTNDDGPEDLEKSPASEPDSESSVSPLDVLIYFCFIYFCCCCFCHLCRTMNHRLPIKRNLEAKEVLMKIWVSVGKRRLKERRLGFRSRDLRFYCGYGRFMPTHSSYNSAETQNRCWCRCSKGQAS